ncbi:hypothetical protein BKA70DRAFT_1240662 [Coprinopsis sp. MPI-PUGE-AT-0042]|nr:hypothetical protein BKA70DRAFT_1240662 [Coprinopsis sp. MPI-PUGE-AT-0042]
MVWVDCGQQFGRGSRHLSVTELVDLTRRIRARRELSFETLETFALVMHGLPHPKTPLSAQTIERACVSFLLLKAIAARSLDVKENERSTTLRQELGSILTIRWRLERNDISSSLGTLKHLLWYMEDEATVSGISRHLRLWNRSKRNPSPHSDLFSRSLVEHLIRLPSVLGNSAISIQNYLRSLMLMANILARLREDRWLWCSAARMELPRIILSGLLDLLRLAKGSAHGKTLAGILDVSQKLTPPVTRHIKIIASAVDIYLELAIQALPKTQPYASQGQLLAQMSLLGRMTAYRDIKFANESLYRSMPVPLVETFVAMGPTTGRIWKDIESSVTCAETYESYNIHQGQMCDNPTHRSQKTMVYKLCSLCKAVGYCSTFCQTKDWRNSHRVLCSQLRGWRNDVTQADFSSPTSAPGDVVVIDLTMSLVPSLTQARSLKSLIPDALLPSCVRQLAQKLLDTVSSGKYLVHGIAPLGINAYLHVLISIRANESASGEISVSSISSLTFSEHVSRPI